MSPLKRPKPSATEKGHEIIVLCCHSYVFICPMWVRAHGTHSACGFYLLKFWNLCAISNHTVRRSYVNVVMLWVNKHRQCEVGGFHSSDILLSFFLEGANDRVCVFSHPFLACVCACVCVYNFRCRVKYVKCWRLQIGVTTSEPLTWKRCENTQKHKR